MSTATASTALATRKETGGQVVVNPIVRDIQKMESAFQLAMPRGAEAKQLVRDAITCVRTIRDLDKCDPASVLGALMTCAQLGLRPGVLGHAWPLPYWDSRANPDENGRGRGGHRAHLVIGYQGYIELGHRSGQIRDIVARTVHANDHFDVDYGLADNLVHKPLMKGPRGDVVAYYAIVRYASGGHTFWVMTHDEMKEWRDLYAPRNRQKEIVGPWVNNFNAMGLKTVILRTVKFMPRSTELAEAVEVDGGLRVDVTPTASPMDVTTQGPVTWDGEVVQGEVEEPAVQPQQAAEEQPKPAKANARKATKVAAPTADRIADEEWPEAAKPADAGKTQHPLDDAGPNLLSPKQHGLIMALSKDLGLSDRDDRMEYINGTIDGPPVASSKELTSAQATAVIDAMQAAKKRQEDQAAKEAEKPVRAQGGRTPAQDRHDAIPDDEIPF